MNTPTSFVSRLKHAWNIFRNQEDDAWPEQPNFGGVGHYSSYNPMRATTITTDRTIITPVTTRIALDVSSFDIRHVRVNEEDRYLETIKSPLNDCLSVEANKDQTGRAFIQDVVLSMFDEGVVAIVPIEADFNPINKPGKFDIFAMRTGKIVAWYPDQVQVELYNDLKGTYETRLLPKRMVGIIENPLYEIMNKPNGTMRRLIDKLNLLDATDNNNASGKLDLIVQLPYVIKSEARRIQAEERRQAIETQLAGSKYGIAYTDGTERITQLNRPVTNTLLEQIEYLTKLLYSQLGITEDVFLGKADEKAMISYYDRTVEPIVTAIIEELRRKFITKTARTQGQTIMGFRNVFKLATATEIAEMADSLRRNEIVSPNEFRTYMGLKPADDPTADERRNTNMPVAPGQASISTESAGAADTSEYDAILEEALNGIEADLMSAMEAYG